MINPEDLKRVVALFDGFGAWAGRNGDRQLQTEILALREVHADMLNELGNREREIKTLTALVKSERKAHRLVVRALRRENRSLREQLAELQKRVAQ